MTLYISETVHHGNECFMSLEILVVLIESQKMIQNKLSINLKKKALSSFQVAKNGVVVVSLYRRYNSGTKSLIMVDYESQTTIFR